VLPASPILSLTLNITLPWSSATFWIAWQSRRRIDKISSHIVVQPDHTRIVRTKSPAGAFAGMFGIGSMLTGRPAAIGAAAAGAGALASCAVDAGAVGAAGANSGSGALAGGSAPN